MQEWIERHVLLGVVVFGVLFSGCTSRLRPPRGLEPVVVKLEATGYCSCGECCGWRRNWLFRPVYTSGPLKGKKKKVGMTASGVMAQRGTIAADTSLYPFGTVMYIEGYGYGRVEDRGGAIKGGRIDLWFSSHNAALAWGRQKGKVVQVWKSDTN